jgi:hypothetical protein
MILESGCRKSVECRYKMILRGFVKLGVDMIILLEYFFIRLIVLT